MNDIDDLVKAIDRAPCAPDQGPGAWELRAQIMATPQARRRFLPRMPAGPGRLSTALAGTAVLATVALLAPALLTGKDGPATAYANAAIDIRLENGEYIATIKDPFADHALYAEGFRALGLDIGLELLPASPTRVGDIVRMGFAGTTSKDRLGGGLEPEGCTPGHEGCLLKVTVSAGFHGKGVAYLGRPAKPGERYQAHQRADIEGEMLDGYTPDERTVGEVVAEARKRGLRVSFQIIKPSPGGGFSMNPREQSATVGDHWVVWAAEPEQAGTVRLIVSEKRVAKNPVHGD